MKKIFNFFWKRQGVKHYSRSSRKRPPRELEKVVVTRAGRLRECDLVCDQNRKQ